MVKSGSFYTRYVLKSSRPSQIIDHLLKINLTIIFEDSLFIYNSNANYKQTFQF